MTVYTHTVASGENPWKFVANSLAEKGDYTNKDVLRNLQKLAEENGCKTPEEFGKKYFYNIGSVFKCSSLESNQVKRKKVAIPQVDTLSFSGSKIDSVQPKTKIKDSITTETKTGRKFLPQRDTIFAAASKTQNDTTVADTTKFKFAHAKVDSTRVHVEQNDTTRVENPNRIVQTEQVKEPKKDNWNDLKQLQDKINNLPSDKEKVIAYNKQLNESRDNYIIVDKKNCTATVYSWDGNIVKEFEVGVAKNDSDVLLKRSYKSNAEKMESTSAGIYTINYRATGRDAYRRLYNDRVFTLSNDGLRARGVGNGETGVAIHQIPNGNSYRQYLMDQEGTQNNRFSSGCVNIRPKDFDELATCIDGVGTKVYILPEDKNNFMTVKNGQLHFTQKEYTGDVATTSTKNDPVKEIRISSVTAFGGESKTMMKVLSDKKSELIKNLGIDNDSYNSFAMLTLGIAQQESEFGANSAITYHIKENAQWFVNTLKDVKRMFGEEESHVNSRGLTQIKLGCYTDKSALDLMKKYNITESNLGQGDKAAIATMIALSSIYKNELSAIKPMMKEQNLTVQDALLYCWQGKKNQITKGIATPDKNIYINNIKKCMDNFVIDQII